MSGVPRVVTWTKQTWIKHHNTPATPSDFRTICHLSYPEYYPTSITSIILNPISFSNSLLTFPTPIIQNHQHFMNSLAVNNPESYP